MKIGLIGINSLKEENDFLRIQNALNKNLFGIFSPQTDEVLPISKNNKIVLFESANELFTKVDAIYFAKSLKPNYDFAINALKKSCHLFIEDISMLNLDEIKHLYKVAFEARTKIQLMLTKSFSPEFLKIKDSVKEPKLIEFNKNFSSPKRRNEYFIWFLNNLFFADLNINSGIKKVSTFTLSLDKNHFSIVQIRLDYENGALVNMKFDNLSVHDTDLIDIHEKGKVFQIDFDKHFSYEQAFTNGQIVRKESDIQKENAFHLEMDHFVNTCKNIDFQNISESPSILKIIQNVFGIMERLAGNSI